MKKTLGERWGSGVLAGVIAGFLTACRSTSPPPGAAALELGQLQGHWEGEGAGGRCSIVIEGDSLHYRAGTNWWRTRFVLPAGTNPRQLHATLVDSSPPTNGIGTVVFAIYKIEDGMLTLAETDGSDSPPETFESASSRYVLRLKRP